MIERFKKNKKTLYLLIILLTLSLNSLLLSLSFNQFSNFDQNSEKKNNPIYNPDQVNLKTQDLSSDNIYSGIGAPWNVTQWANRTDYDQAVKFDEGSYELVEITSGNDWEGYELDAEIKNLYDTRNWCNGTFNFGDDNGYQTPDAGTPIVNDSATIPRISNNKFQNWTFHVDDTGTFAPYTSVTNPMSGNYIDSSRATADFEDCLELRMDAGSRDIFFLAWDAYDNGDRCMWNSSMEIPRGDLINATLEFDVRPDYLVNYNVFALSVYINNKKVYTRGTHDIEVDAGGEDNWHHITHPQSKWINETNVFSGNLNDSSVIISVALESFGSNFRGISNRERQILYIDNVELYTRAEVKPNQIGLKLNNTDIDTIGYGLGEKCLKSNGNNWQPINNKTYFKFNCTDSWDLGDFNIELSLDSNFFIRKNALETIYKPDPISIGTKFNLENGSNVNWLCYEYIQLPDGFFQKNMSLEFPEDLNITSVFKSQDHDNSILELCNNSTKGLLIIPMENITKFPGGYWKFEGISPNYCENLNLYRNTTANPSGTDWTLDTNFIAGDYINITANIRYDPLITNYIHLTQAKLQIRFPNGSIWTAKNNYSNPDAPTGLVRFEKIRIPKDLGYDYQVGEYEVIITWNNSFSNLKCNETGIIYKTFTVLHDSTLKPNLDIYNIENVLNNTILNIEVSFKDKISANGIDNALVYINNSGDPSLRFFKRSPGEYLYEFNSSKFTPSNVTLCIYAEHPFYINQNINMSIDVIEDTILTVNNDFLSGIPQNSNFSVLFNYTRKYNGEGIDNIILETDWATNQYFLKNIGLGEYNLTCNSTGYEPNIQNLLNFTVRKTGYLYQSEAITVILTEINTEIELYLNDTQREADYYFELEIWQKIKVEVIYKDTNGNPIGGANVSINGTVYSDYLKESPIFPGNYSIMLNATDIGKEIDPIRIFASKTNYKPENIQFLIGIIQRQSIMEIFINSVNYTIDPSIELPLGRDINLTIRYYDIIGKHIDGASVNLTLDLNTNLTEYQASNQYFILIDASDLNLGVNIIKITASKVNYESQTENLRITVRKIKTLISIEDDEFEIKSGEDITLELEALDLDNGGRISGLIINYDWKLKDGDFDQISHGFYEAELKDVPEGTYTITISIIDPSGQYEVADIEITLIVTGEAEESTFWLVLFIIAVVVGSALAGYIIAYQLYLKYPKPVRKVRKYRRTLKRSKSPSIDIMTRQKSFNETFKDKTSQTSDLVKSKGKIKDTLDEKNFETKQKSVGVD